MKSQRPACSGWLRPTTLTRQAMCTPRGVIFGMRRQSRLPREVAPDPAGWPPPSSAACKAIPKAYLVIYNNILYYTMTYHTIFRISASSSSKPPPDCRTGTLFRSCSCRDRLALLTARGWHANENSNKPPPCSKNNVLNILLVTCPAKARETPACRRFADLK